MLVTVTPNEQLSSYIWYTAATRTINFEGSKNIANLAGKVESIEVKMIDELGNEIEFSQVVFFEAPIVEKVPNVEELEDAAVEAAAENEDSDVNFAPETEESSENDENETAAGDVVVTENIPEDEKIVEIEQAIAVAGMPADYKVPPITKKQADLVKTPVDDIPAEALFTPIPLAARLTTGVPNVKALVLKQREATKAAANSPA